VRPAEFTEMDLVAAAGVATITLNRPQRRNAWGGRTALEYRWALHWCHTNPDVRVVVLAGEQDFCVGADSGLLDSIGENGGGYQVDRADLPEFPADTPPGMRRNHFYPLAISTPVIAAICGGCAGAGFLLASYADIRFADADARIASSFAGLGLPAEYGIGWLLPRVVGLPNAAQLLYSPGAISAARAAALGWVQRVSEPGEVLADAVGYARGLASGSSAQSLRMMKRQLFIDSTLEFDQAYRLSVNDMNTALQTQDFRYGVRAIKGKGTPNFLAAHSPE
jgi:enoyl-CoA hydratase/carnithine racemase